MKKTILLLQLCLLFQTIQAQITVSHTYQKGTYLSACDSMVPNTISIGSKGTNQIWDFTGLRNIYPDTSIYMDASASPYFSKFPNANLALYQTTTVTGIGKSYSYFSVDANNHAQLYGSYIYGPAPVGNVTAYVTQPYIDTLSSLTYGKVNIDTMETTETFPFTFTGIDSMKTITTEIIFDTVDAWGTVILPGNISYNSLRVKSISYNQFDSYVRFFRRRLCPHKRPTFL